MLSQIGAVFVAPSLQMFAPPGGTPGTHLRAGTHLFLRPVLATTTGPVDSRTTNSGSTTIR
jgi:hypothetical protein